VVGLRSLRQAICDDSAARRSGRHSVDQVVVSAGAKHSLFNLAQVLFDHGDEVVIPVPAWGSYAEQVRLCGAQPVLVATHESDAFLLQPAALAQALGPATKAIILCTPNNPTGAAYSAVQLAALADVLRATRAYVIVDEIYSELTYDGFVSSSLLSVAPDLADRLIIVDGVSKRFAMTGYRVGWMLGPEPIARACEAVQSQATTSVAAVAQLAAQAALLGPAAPVLAMRDAFAARRDGLVAAINAIDGLHVATPRGAFYLFVSVAGLIGRGGLRDDIDIGNFLLDRARVAVVPGTAFHAPGYVRLSYATSTTQLSRATARIAEALAGLPL
jgi:aspartate aminotransferase